MKTLSVCVVFVVALLAVQSAWAQKASVITKLDGAAYVVRACATHNWIAGWARQADGSYDLYVVNGENGTKQKVTNERDPGGICWIPNSTRLLYSKGVKNDKVKFIRVIYYTYDTATQKSRKLTEVNDLLETYSLDPIASENGDSAVHMTIVGTKQGDLPSINVYNTGADVLMPLPSEANIAGDYDLSADGKRLFWLLHDAETGNLFIVGWDIDKRTYSDIYEYGASADPADDHAFLKVQSTSNRAATLAVSDSDPTLKLCTYDFNNVKSLYIQPLHLKASEEIVCFDWKGRGEVIYALIQDTANNQYLVEEINVITGARTRLLTTPDPISFIDYSANDQTYYYSVVSDKGGKTETSLIRLK